VFAVDKLEYGKRLEDLAKPFVKLGIYDSTEKFLKDVIKNISTERIRTYKRIISKYEKRYGSFEEFTKRLEGKAKPKLEDDWMDWESARNMLGAWKKASQELGISAS
jgi:hypothetical protein